MTSTRAPFTWDWDAPSTPAPPAPLPVAPPVASASTRWVWLLAFGLYLWGIPVGIVNGVALVVIPEAERQLHNVTLVMLVAAVLALVPLWVFAELDIRALRARLLPAPSILWMLLLPPIGYFLARRHALRGTGAPWLGPQIALGVIVGSQVLSAIGSLLLGGVALIATLATGAGG